MSPHDRPRPAIDAVLFAVALLILEPRAVAVSFAGAVVINLVIAINHRRDCCLTT